MQVLVVLLPDGTVDDVIGPFDSSEAAIRHSEIHESRVRIPFAARIQYLVTKLTEPE